MMSNTLARAWGGMLNGAGGVVAALLCVALQACAEGGSVGCLGIVRRIPPLSEDVFFPRPRALLTLTSLRLRGGSESSSTDEERVWRPEPKPWDRAVAHAAFDAALAAERDRDSLASHEAALSETDCSDDAGQQQDQGQLEEDQKEDDDPAADEREGDGASNMAAEDGSCGEEARADGADEDGGFPAITAEDGHALNVGSLCFKCKKQGMTRILPSTIPWFGRVLVMSFECPHCGEANTEVQSAAEIQPYGQKITLKVGNRDDADRQVIRSRHCTVSIPEIQLEMPAFSGGAVLTTVEGLLTRAAEDLEMDQDRREEAQAAAIAKVIHGLRVYAAREDVGEWMPYTVVIDDPTGNSQIEGEAVDSALTRERYVRTDAQNVEIGIYSEQVPDEEGEKQHQQQVPSSEVTCESAGGDGTSRRVSNQGAVQWGQQGSRSGGGVECILGAVAASGGKEVESFMVHCPGCAVEDLEKMYLTDIPHFGEILIMAFNCQACGYRNTEIKPGSSGRRGRRIELHVERDEDWDRLVLKGAGCKMIVPELELELESGAMGSTLTTVEGLLEKVYEHLASTRPFTSGDSHATATSTFAKRLQVFLGKLDDVRKLRQSFTLILEDPLGHSNIEPPRSACAGVEDQRMVFEEYDYNEEEEEEQEEGYFEDVD